MIKEYLKKWIMIFIIAVLDLLIAAKTSLPFFYFFFWLLIWVVAISFFWVFIEYFLAVFKVRRIVDSRVREGDLLTLEAQITNGGPLPIFNFILEDGLSCAPLNDKKRLLVIDYLPSGVSRTIRYSCRCPQRGKYRIGPLVLYFFDPLGIFFLKRKYNIFSDIYVFPRIFKIRNFPVISKGSFPWFGIESGRVTGEDDEFYGIREYRENDPVKRIHWVSTARKNRLMVKQFQHQAFYKATIIFNLESGKNYGQGTERVAEYIIRIAASVSKYLLDNNVALEIFANTGELVHIPANKGPEYLEDILRFLTLAEAKSKVSLVETFEEFYRHVPNDTTLVVIMLDKDWEVISKIMSLEKRNVSLVPLILISSTFLYSFEKLELLKDIKIKLTKSFNFTPLLISRGDSLEEVFLKS